jgi:RNA recognition motif-containing protein
MTSIFVAKLDFGVTKEQLTELFEEHGKVNRVNIPTDKDTGKPRGFAFVEMFDQKEAENAINALDGYEINRRTLAVKIAEDRGDTKRSPGKSFSSSNKDSQHSSPRTNPTSDNKASNSTSDNSNQDQKKKSSKSRKRSFENDSERGKKTKMQAHKKSGKSFRYIEEDEPLENDLFLFDKDDDESIDDN